MDVFNRNSRKAFYKFKYARNPSFYGNSTVSTKSNLNKTSPGLRMSNFNNSEENEDPTTSGHITHNTSCRNKRKTEEEDRAAYPMSTTEIFNDQFAQDVSGDN